MSFDIGKSIECDHRDYDDDGNLVAYDLDSCPKCLGKGYYYDFNLVSGNVEKVENLDLLEELAVKYVLTEQGTDRLNKSFGTNLLKILGEPGHSTFEALRRRLEREVVEALSVLRLRQIQQQETGQEVTDEEALARIDAVDVRFVEPRNLEVEVVLTNKAGQTVHFRL